MIKLMAAGVGLRGLALMYGTLMDRVMDVKYTDYDYKVFSDAAQCVLSGKSPYDRITYRYTPLLAYMLTPNFLLFYEFGKILFALFDIVCAILLNKIFIKMNVSTETRLYAVGAWLLFPLSILISTRGSVDSFIVMLSLLSLYLILTERYTVAAIVFGLAVHFKIYPIIYAVPFFLFIGARHTPSGGKFSVLRWIRTKFTPESVRFAIISASVFIGLTYVFYRVYGYKFLYESYLYHLVRKDHRHNMSLYFNSVHLFYDSEYGKLVGMIAFIPQWAMVLLFGIVLHRDPGVCMFFQTFLFVIFNKVCTAQYFVWFMGLLPLLIPRNKVFERSKLGFLFGWGAWFLSETIILHSAYKLEMLGENAFMGIFRANSLFFIGSVTMLCVMLHNQQIVDVAKAIEKKKVA